MIYLDGQEQRSIKGETTEQEQQNTVSDPIMLLAAAAAAIDGRTDESTAAIYSLMDRQEMKKTNRNGPGYGLYIYFIYYLLFTIYYFVFNLFYFILHEI